jgi:ketosteroid isomerase-like protein
MDPWVFTRCICRDVQMLSGNGCCCFDQRWANQLHFATEKLLAQAMRTNDADGFCRLLDPDWAVVDGIGGFDDGVGKRDSLCAAIKAGTFTRKTYDTDLANSRVRVYGNIATVTFKLSVSGASNHKNFSVKEVQTDVLSWEGGGWKCVLTHETNVWGTLVQ